MLALMAAIYKQLQTRPNPRAGDQTVYVLDSGCLGPPSRSHATKRAKHESLATAEHDTVIVVVLGSPSEEADSTLQILRQILSFFSIF